MGHSTNTNRCIISVYGVCNHQQFAVLDGSIPMPISREITQAGKRAFWWFGGV
jgi:hypothetical protein